MPPSSLGYLGGGEDLFSAASVTLAILLWMCGAKRGILEFVPPPHVLHCVNCSWGYFGGMPFLFLAGMFWDGGHVLSCVPLMECPWCRWQQCSALLPTIVGQPGGGVGCINVNWVAGTSAAIDASGPCRATLPSFWKKRLKAWKINPWP